MNYQSIGEMLGLTQATPTPLDLVEITRTGIPKRAISTLAECFDLTIPELTKYLHVSERTLQRYTPEKLLSSPLSDHLLQMAKVYAKSLDVFEDAEDTTCWLKQPSLALGNIAPIELLDTSSGIEMVLDELIRIEYGVVA
ncbi:antitoxin Xre/MbcA/ParS toxin-binding domain-containing protein [Deltaproteobacteria bacterium TL4]